MLEERASGEHVRCRVGGAVITEGAFNALPFDAIVHTVHNPRPSPNPSPNPSPHPDPDPNPNPSPRQVPPFWPRAEDHATDDGGAALAAARTEWAYISPISPLYLP